MVKTWFFCQDCPLAEGCSQKSWKNAGAWGETEDLVRSAVVDHLVRSGHHHLSKADAKNMAQLCEIKSYDEDTDEEGTQQPKKKQKTTKQHAIGAPVMQQQQQQQQLQQLQGHVQMLRDELQQQQQQLQQLPLSMPSASSSGLLQPLSEEARGSMMTMRVTEFMSALDCINRALTSASKAEQICLQASRAFHDEVLALTSVKQNLEAIKASANIQ